MEGIIDVDIPITIIPNSDDPSCSVVIDAVYIPTIGERKNLQSIIQIIYPWTKKIFLLFSNKRPNWINNEDLPNVLFIEDFADNFHDDFINHRCTNNPTFRVSKSYDIPSKRNFALAHAKENNFLYIGLIDDDILIGENQMRLINHNLGNSQFDLIGFHVVEYPDVSIIDHLERFITKTPSEVSISGNCLFLNMKNTVGFFPYVYNEDWIFIFSNIIAKKNVGSLGYVKQLEHEPWKDLNRVKFEQFGDMIIWGIYNNLLDNSYFPNNINFWSKIYNEYILRLQKLKLQDSEGKWEEVLINALEQCYSFKPIDLKRFIDNLNTEINK